MTSDDLIRIAVHLKTRYESKGHGGYCIYEDQVIKIMYDTYYPNIDVFVKDGKKQELVYIRSGHGYVQEHHPGFWEKYVDEVLTPRAKESEAQHQRENEEMKRAEHNKKFGAIDDAHIFPATQ